MIDWHLNRETRYPFGDRSPDPEYSDTLELDLSTVQASLAGPKRPQDRVLLGEVDKSFKENLLSLRKTASVQNPGGPVTG